MRNDNFQDMKRVPDAEEDEYPQAVTRDNPLQLGQANR